MMMRKKKKKRKKCYEYALLEKNHLENGKVIESNQSINSVENKVRDLWWMMLVVNAC